MDAQLRKVLKVNRAFEHEYDFGSTTHLDLKVISERQGGLKRVGVKIPPLNSNPHPIRWR